ncbi:AraC family transcriptional regulator [Jannaschia donghaensis]|uniref:L-rhamnose operon regulatory protein RhaS n=1 Tax=Jannaschia donghaensis TaxID=420998 RepID=A0A0M6YNC4_9RHOB|nr:AraC family transcriptional regulator [Jannaschia donghaensis]CTQ50516.1 L-rhamnose operon regulatory protein RhaS [Jannaschia donghaensis]
MNDPLRTLTTKVARSARTDGIHATPVPRLHLIRSGTPTQDIHAVHEPAICIVVQGAKRVLLGEQVYEYDAARYLAVSFDLPIVGQVTQATPDRPYLCLKLDIEASLLAELAAGLPWDGGGGSGAPGLSLGRTTPNILDAADRLVGLVETPADVAPLAPLYERELLYRVLSAPGGRAVARAVLAPGPERHVARAIAWIRERYREPFEMARLSEAARMQPSALHQHFKAITQTSPLQYQKRLRLLEARRLMLFEARSAAEAAFAVGYESPSQFSREYHRQFGKPPVRDIKTFETERRTVASL